MGMVGCYSLTLYCDDPKHDRWHSQHGGKPNAHSYWPGDYTGRTLREARAEAKRFGWKIRATREVGEYGTGKTICPRCSKRAASGQERADG